MHAADRHEGAADVRKLAGLEIQDLAPLDARRRRVDLLAGRRAGLAPDAPVEVGDDRPAGHAGPPIFVTFTLTRSAPEPVASVNSSIIGVSAFMLGALSSLAKGVVQ